MFHFGCSQLVENEFNHLYPGEVKAVHMVYNCDDLDKLVTEYDKLKGQALDLIDTYATKMHRGKKVKRKKVGVHLSCEVPALDPFISHI